MFKSQKSTSVLPLSTKAWGLERVCCNQISVNMFSKKKAFNPQCTDVIGKTVSMAIVTSDDVKMYWGSLNPSGSSSLVLES